MAEYIEREAFKSKLKNMEATSPNKAYQNAMEDMIYYFIPKIIDEFPAADVVPVRHGHWIAMGDCGVTRCSCCGWSFEECIEDKYCRGCGAKMDETS